MNSEEQARIIEKWRRYGSPEIPLWHGVFVGDLPVFLAHCIKTDNLGSILNVVQFLQCYQSESVGHTHTASLLKNRRN